MKKTVTHSGIPRPYEAPGCKIVFASPSAVLCQSLPLADHEDFEEFEEFLFNL